MSDWREVLFVGNRAISGSTRGGGQEVHVEPCCDVHKVPAWAPLTGISTPQRLGTSVQ